MHGGYVSRTNPVAVARWVRRRYRASTPVDAVWLASRMGLRVECTCLPAHRPGYLICCDPDVQVILLNRRDSVHRRNWTCAHELGHYVMHRDVRLIHAFSSGRRCPSQRLLEREANRFAAELLMPAGEVLELAPTMCFLRLAAHFGVSRQAMHLRLLEMNM
ncbi:MAG: ImmA/IrrE family metallo-endopeptidase [Limnochordia bacterium]